MFLKSYLIEKEKKHYIFKKEGSKRYKLFFFNRREISFPQILSKLKWIKFKIFSCSLFSEDELGAERFAVLVGTCRHFAPSHMGDCHDGITRTMSYLSIVWTVLNGNDGIDGSWSILEIGRQKFKWKKS